MTPFVSDAAQRGARGASAISIGQFCKLGIQLAGTVVLSRLLSPADFGLVALVTVFLALGELVRDFGMPTAALQARDLTHQQASNFFWVNALLGLVGTVALTSATPLLIALYDEPRLRLVVPVMACTMFINGLEAQVQVQLARSMRFGTLAATDICAQVIGFVVAIVGAAAGWGPWAIVAQQLTATVVLLSLRCVLARWVPSRPLRGHDSRRLLRSGADIGLAQLLAFAANYTDTLVIGARWAAVDLGYYNRAFQLYQLPRNALLDPLTQVVVPTLNASVTEGRRASEVLLRIQFALSALLTWVYVILAVTAVQLVPLVLGDQWGRSAHVLQLLAIGGCFAAFGTVSYWTFIVERQSRQLLLLHLVTKTMAVACVLVGGLISVEAVALGYSLALAIAWPINLLWLARVAGQDSWAFFAVGLRVLTAAASAVVVGAVTLDLVDVANSWLAVGIGASAATISYTAVLLLVPGGRTYVAAAALVARSMVRRARS